MGFLGKKKIGAGMLNEYHDHANYYIEKHNLLFLNIPKVASSTLWSVAARLHDDFKTEEAKQVRQYKLPAIRSSKIHLYPEVRKVAFVRNPFDRLVSAYRQKILGNKRQFIERNKLDAGLSFEAFADFVCSTQDHNADRHFRSQFSYLYNYQGECIVDFLGRLESFHTDMNRLIKQFQLPAIKIPHWNKTPQTDYKTFYTKALRDKVEKRYALDLECLGYSFEKGLETTRQEDWKKTLSTERKLEILNYKSNKLLRVVRYKERHDDLPKGIKGILMRRYHYYFTDYFDMDIDDVKS